MGSSPSKKKKKIYETSAATEGASGGTDHDRKKDVKKIKKKNKKEKKDKDKKEDKKKKDKKDKKKKNTESPKTIESPVRSAPHNLYHREDTSMLEETRTELPEPYSMEKPTNQRISVDSDNEYSSLYEGEGKGSSPLYENQKELNDQEEDEESLYVLPENVPHLPPKKPKNTEQVVTEQSIKPPAPLPNIRGSGECRKDVVSFIDQSILKTENVERREINTTQVNQMIKTESEDSETEYDDTVVRVEEPSRPPILKPKPKPHPAGDDSQEIKVVVAIDFGTTFTGYAYSYVDEKETIHMNPNWASGKAASFKTPTWVAIDEYGELHAFGFEAQSTYNEEEDAKDTPISLYKEFKLQLMKKGAKDEVVVLTSEYGQPLPALKVFGAAVKFLKDTILKRFQDAGKVFRPWQICWVLTVPAIWDDAQKLFMKEAAKEAGLVRNVDDKHLLIALEPEAASMYCRTLKMNNFKDGRGESTVKLPRGTIYIVLDAGGGTIDITVHKVLEENKIAEIYQANGGPWGGSKINGSFETKLKGILGDEFVVHCQKENPGVWLDLILEFEQAKQSDAARPDSKKSMIVNIGYGLSTCYREFMGEPLESAIAQHQDSGMKINKTGKLEVSPENVRSMFSTVVGKTVDHMYNILQKPEISKASVIFIVGGFGQCPYLQEEVKKHFHDASRKVLVPIEGNLCVVKGAVMFGHQPDFISSRIAKHTYAYLDTRMYDSATDGNREQFQLNGESVVACLTPIIEKGAIVNYSEERTVEFNVATEHFTLPIYCSESTEVDDPQAAEVTQMGELLIELPTSTRESSVEQTEKVKVTFTLSTELKVKGTHLASNTSTETTLRMKRGKKSFINSS